MTRHLGLVGWLTVASVTLLAGAVRADFTPLGPSPYLSFSDSPFSGLSFGAFYLEDCEDGLFNVPGVTAISNTPGTTIGPIPPGPNSDSVDGDDGAIDGLGRAGWLLAEVNNLSTDDLGYTFVFHPASLGALPTHAGLVWTDGNIDAATLVEFYGPADELLGTIGPVYISDNSFAGETAEDRFFGAINTSGISRIVIRSQGGNNNLSVDHLQYGLPVPEPSSMIVLVIGALGALGWSQRRDKMKVRTTH